MAGRGGMRGILPGTEARFCASSFPPHASGEDSRQALNLYVTVRRINCEQEGGPRLKEIVYRSSSREADTRYHVFCFDLRNYLEIFERGFEAPPQGDTPDEIYYNLLDYVNNAETPHGFVSTTISPCLATRYRNPVGTLVYRYEIYAPGGVLVAPTLANRCNFPDQQQVAFVRGIAPQYILSAQIFRITDHDSKGFAVLQRDEPDWPYRVLNTNFRLPPPEPGIPQRIVNPACTYLSSENRRATLRVVLYLGERLAPPDGWERYIFDLTDCESYIDAALRSPTENQAYLFTRNEYALFDYSTDGYVVKGPQLICGGFPSLADTPFGEYGIDCAFKIQNKNEAFIFFDNLCARLNFELHDKITKGPSTIASIFPFLSSTEFVKGVDAAFDSFRDNEAYLFRGSQYARINYSDSAAKLIATGLISQGFPCLAHTIFKDGINAAFASQSYNEAYIFRGASYALINFSPDNTADAGIIDGVKEITQKWPSLCSILPRKNYGLDVHNHSHSKPAESGGGHVHGVL